MKKHVSQLFLVIAVLIIMISTGFSPSSPVYAATPMVKNAVFVDKNNHSFIPFRFLNGYAGITTTWNPAEKRMDIVKKDIKLTLYLGQATAYINDKPVSLTDLAFSDNGITYVPLSFVSEALGMQLEWNAMASSLSLQSGDTSATLPVLAGALIPQESQAIVSSKKNYKVGSRSFSVQTVTIALLHPKVKLDVVLAGNTVGKVEELSSLAKRNNAIVAINGTFFDAYTKGDYKAPYGYIVSGGKMLKNSSGDRRAIFTYDKNHLAALIPGLDFKDQFAANSIEGGLQAGPRLLTDGKISLDVKGEGFKDPKILTGGGARSALGLTRDHKLILLTSSGATIPQLAEIMKQAGAYQAMNLDGGASSGLYYNGKYLTTPGRQISNAIVVKYQ
ncbi:phosphodiester glycosidase family protein [Paenibacillus wynnii]|uniref:phosphodiester glycosidase family protein n=1 Tax=Paenibacillus wynnii TaxID=268407 RepID=UPI00278FE559|nr:phosphodiester glycosidase family protein [Paenibacillus wynnii]MDQ0194071.1 exopolysaccharide biosynthesis protein [Paenibacillus wynnii]